MVLIKRVFALPVRPKNPAGVALSIADTGEIA
jgi:hypothetical protein